MSESLVAKRIEKDTVVVYTEKQSGGTFPKVNSNLKALGFGGSVPYAFFVFGEMFRTMLRLRPYKSCDAESVVM